MGPAHNNLRGFSPRLHGGCTFDPTDATARLSSIVLSFRFETYLTSKRNFYSVVLSVWSNVHPLDSKVWQVNTSRVNMLS